MRPRTSALVALKVEADVGNPFIREGYRFNPSRAAYQTGAALLPNGPSAI
jgi:hypothetical protein